MVRILFWYFIYAYVRLQHSQFWIPFTGALGRSFMPPTQHQIQNSIDPRRHNKNFGSRPSLFDWLFGTLALPSVRSARLKFGVAQNGADLSIPTLPITPVLAALGLLAAAAARRAPDSPQNTASAAFNLAEYSHSGALSSRPARAS